MHRAKYYLALKTRHTIPGAAGQRTLVLRFRVLDVLDPDVAFRFLESLWGRHLFPAVAI